MKTTTHSKILRSKNNPLLLPLSCLSFTLALSCAPLLNAQVVLQDNFTYTTSNLEGHAPTVGSGIWTTEYTDECMISADGNQAVVSVAKGKLGESGKVRASYSFTPGSNTVYTLKVTFKVKTPIGAGKDVWFGIGFSNPENVDSDDPWMLIRFPRTDKENGTMEAIHETLVRFGRSNFPGADCSAPITASIKWNTATGEAQYYINDKLQKGCGGKTAPPTNERNIYFQAWQTGNILTVSNVTLTAEPVKDN